MNTADVFRKQLLTGMKGQLRAFSGDQQRERFVDAVIRRNEPIVVRGKRCRDACMVRIIGHEAGEPSPGIDKYHDPSRINRAVVLGSTECVARIFVRGTVDGGERHKITASFIRATSRPATCCLCVGHPPVRTRIVTSVPLGRRWAPGEESCHSQRDHE